MQVNVNKEGRTIKYECRFEKLNQLVSGDLDYKEELKILILEFLINFRKQFQNAIEQKDRTTLKNLVHKSKPSWKLLEAENIENEFATVLEMLTQPTISSDELANYVEKINSICHFFSNELVKW